VIQSHDRQAAMHQPTTSRRGHESRVSRRHDSQQSPVSAIGEVRRYNKNTVSTTRCYRMRFEQYWAGATTVAMRGRTARENFFSENFRTYGRKNRDPRHGIAE